MEIYIVFSDAKTMVSKIIRVYTRYTYSHVSLAFDRELNDMYSFRRRDTENPFNRGFVKENIRNRLLQEAHCAVYSCRVTGEDWTQMRNYVLQIEQAQEQFKYNVQGIFGILMNRTVDREDRFFCSQFVSSVLLKGGVQVSDKPLSLIKPGDIEQTEGLDLVYQGPVNRYPYGAVVVNADDVLMEVL